MHAHFSKKRKGPPACVQLRRTQNSIRVTLQSGLLGSGLPDWDGDLLAPDALRQAFVRWEHDPESIKVLDWGGCRIDLISLCPGGPDGRISLELNLTKPLQAVLFSGVDEGCFITEWADTHYRQMAAETGGFIVGLGGEVFHYCSLEYDAGVRPVECSLRRDTATWDLCWKCPHCGMVVDNGTVCRMYRQHFGQNLPARLYGSRIAPPDS